MTEEDRKYFAHIEAFLERKGLPRTRENFLRNMYDTLPEEWDWESEEQLPEDLRLDPAPSVPIPTYN
jgi:hypothetical protein